MTKGRGRGYLRKVAKSENHTTPTHIVEVVEEVFGSIDLDPCSNPSSPVRAARRIWLPKWEDYQRRRGEEIPEDVEIADGLEVVWDGKKYLNPPYTAKALDRFLGKAVADVGRGASIALIPSKTDIQPWHAHLSKAGAICLIKGRLKFGGAKSGATFASTLAIWSEEKSEIDLFCMVMRDKGIGQLWRPA